MNLKSLYSKLIMNVCENKYSDADKNLDAILTEKVKVKVNKAVKETDGCGKSKRSKKCCR